MYSSELLVLKYVNSNAVKRDPFFGSESEK